MHQSFGINSDTNHVITAVTQPTATKKKSKKKRAIKKVINTRKKSIQPSIESSYVFRNSKYAEKNC